MHPDRGDDERPPTYLLLGAPAVRTLSEPRVISGRVQCALFVTLALRAGHPVGADRLVDALWGDDPPTDWVNALQSQVSRLRQALGRTLAHGVGGYRLDAPAESVDAHRFERLIAEAGQLQSAGVHALARRTVDRAERLWRGEPFPELKDTDLARREGARLDELRMQAAVIRIEADLALRHHGPAILALRQLTEAYPMREDLWGLLILALYRSDRTADALTTYRQARSTLVRELGIEPGPSLRELEAAVLHRDPALAAPAHPCAAHAQIYAATPRPLRQLPCPPEAVAGQPPRAWADYPAARTFLERARAAIPDYRPDDNDAVAIVTLCRLLRGDPVAIELAAGRLPSLSPTHLLELHLAAQT